MDGKEPWEDDEPYEWDNESSMSEGPEEAGTEDDEDDTPISVHHYLDGWGNAAYEMRRYAGGQTRFVTYGLATAPRAWLDTISPRVVDQYAEWRQNKEEFQKLKMGLHKHKAMMIKRLGSSKGKRESKVMLTPTTPDSVCSLPEPLKYGPETYDIPPKELRHGDDEYDEVVNARLEGRCFGATFGRDRCMRTRKEATDSPYQQVRTDAAGLLTLDRMFCSNHQDKRERYYVEENIRAKSREWALLPAYLLVIEIYGG